MSHNNDGAAILTGIVISLVLLYLAIVAIVVLLATMALFIIGWYITYLLIHLFDEISDEQLIAEHGGLLLLLSAGLWAGVAWLLIRPHWLAALTDIWPGVTQYPGVIPLTGVVLGLAWAMLVLFAHDTQAKVDLLDISGMYHFSETELHRKEPDVIDRLTDSILLGTDVDV